MTLADARQRGWEELDIVLVSGDAYVDHPAFGVALLARVLEEAGYRVGVLSQPDWRAAEPFRALGRPRLMYGIGAGNVDSMLAHYTPRRRKRHEDPFSPDGQAGRRPDRATAVYAQRCREAYKGVPVVIGGIEASLRRLAHWDHWSRTIRPSMLASSKADLLVYGMGERALLDAARCLDEGGNIRDLRGRPGTCHLLGKHDAPPAGAKPLPSFEELRDRPQLLAEATRAHAHQDHPKGLPLLQRHGDRTLVHAPPEAPPTTGEMDRWYALPFTRKEHPGLRSRVPALETVRWSVTTHRGCFGGCSFCSLAEHQGRHVVSRSRDSILAELRRITEDRAFPGTISDVGGPSADMYGLGCRDADKEAACRRRSCLHPRICPNLVTDHKPWIGLLRAARALPRVRHVRVSSGVRMDLLLRHPEALEELARHHVGGQLKVAPEHDRSNPLAAMRKYPPGILGHFKRSFDMASQRADKRQFLVPYLICGHPGTTTEDMAHLARAMEQLGFRPRQVQDFTPTPMTLSTAQHVSGIDPLTRKAVAAVRGDKARDEQRAIVQWFLPRYSRLGEGALRNLGFGDVIRGERAPRRRKRDR